MRGAAAIENAIKKSKHYTETQKHYSSDLVYPIKA